jgi:hypothetical protein
MKLRKSRKIMVGSFKMVLDRAKEGLQRQEFKGLMGWRQAVIKQASERLAAEVYSCIQSCAYIHLCTHIHLYVHKYIYVHTYTNAASLRHNIL